jgi:ribosomal protein L31E
MSINPLNAAVLVTEIPALPNLEQLQLAPYDYVIWFITFCELLINNKILEYGITDITQYNILVERPVTTPLPTVLDVPLEDIKGLSKEQRAQNDINILKYLPINAILKHLLGVTIDKSILNHLKANGIAKHELDLPKLLTALNKYFLPEALGELDNQLTRLSTAKGITDIHSLINTYNTFNIVTQLANRTFQSKHVIQTLSVALNNMGHNATVIAYHTDRLKSDDAEDIEKFIKFLLRSVKAASYKTKPLISQTGLLNPLITDAQLKTISTANSAVTSLNIADLATKVDKLTDSVNQLFAKPFCSTHGPGHASADCKNPSPTHNNADTPTNWTNKAQHVAARAARKKK